MFDLGSESLPRSIIPDTRSRRKDAGKSPDPARKHRKSLEHGSSIADFFPVDSCQLPLLSGRNWPEIIGKTPTNFRPEYCFHKISRITLNHQFQGRILRPGFLFNVIDEINLYLIFILSSAVT